MKNSPEFSFLLLRAAQQRWSSTGNIGYAEKSQLQRLARDAYLMQQKVIRSEAAAGVDVCDATLRDALMREMSQWESRDAMLADLAQFDLDEDGLRFGLARELVFEAVLGQIGASVGTVTREEALAYYRQEQERFNKPELRSARHILITVNDDYAENRQAVALQRIEAIAEAINSGEETFVEAAGKHSECPTAMNGGWLGKIPAGVLYPELDKLLFDLKVGELRSAVSSELGYHLLWCDEIHMPEHLPFDEVAPQIEALLTAKEIKAVQREWLKQLPG